MLYSVVSTTSCPRSQLRRRRRRDLRGRHGRQPLEMGRSTTPERIGSTTEAADRDPATAQWPFKKFFEAAPATIGTVDYYKNFMFPPAAAYKDGRSISGSAVASAAISPLEATMGATTENNRFYVMIDSDPYETAPIAGVGDDH